MPHMFLAFKICGLKIIQCRKKYIFLMIKIRKDIQKLLQTNNNINITTEN